MVMNDVQLHLAESALRLYADSSPERNMSKVYDEGKRLLVAPAVNKA